MKMIEAAYFIFFLPLSAIETTELSMPIVQTIITSLLSLVNLLFFAFFHLLKSKHDKWKYEVRLKGYWVEVSDVKGNE